MSEEKSGSGVDQEGSTARTEAHASGPLRASGWERFYALGWYGRDGRPYLTTWDGGARPVVSMLSINCAPHRIPMWDATVPEGAELIEMPPDALTIRKYVQQNSGIRVIGWRTETEFERFPWDGSRESPVVAPQ